MASLNGLPAFFQASTKTVLDELADFELGGGLDEDVGIHGSGNDEDLGALGDLDINGAFGDLNADNLPDFFKNPTQLEQENYDILDSVANQTLDEDNDFGSIPLPPGARASTAYPASYPAPSAQKLPPGLGSVKPAAAPVVAPHYKDAFNKPTAAPVSAPQPTTTPAGAPGLPRAAGPPAVAISYARAAGAVTSAAPVLGNPPQQAPQVVHAPHLPYPVAPQMMPQPGPTGAAGAFLSAHPAYILNPPQHPAGILRGTSASTTTSAGGASVGAHSTTSGFSAQKPLLFNSNTGFSVPTDNGNAQQHRKELPRGKFMSPSDVRYVVNKVLQPMETTDPFADDFYFLQLNIKKNAAAREAALKGQTELPKAIYVPLPVWKETKERIRLQMDVSRRSFHDKSREWEQKEKVLGHQVRSDIHRPREQLAMPNLSEMDFFADGATGDDEDVGEMKSPFSSRLWTMRQAVQRGYEALYTVQELQHLQSSPLIASNPIANEEICREIDSAVALLSQSIGIRSNNTVANPAGAAVPYPGPEADFSLDGGHVGAILQTTIGKKLMSRSLKLLTPPHRWALLPVILAKILLSPPAVESAGPSTGGAPSSAALEALAVEQRLLKTIIEFLQYSYQYQIEQQLQVPPGAVAVFSNILLTNLRQCIKSVIVTQMEKSKLRQALISERTRAEVMHMVVQIGDKIQLAVEVISQGEKQR